MPVVGYCRNSYNNLCPCFVCSKKFSVDNGVEDLLTHICFTHRIIIENVDQISDFKKYMEYYTKRFKEASLDTFTKQITIEIPEKDLEPREQKYHLLGSFLPEDRELREILHSKRLKAAQKQQKRDLSDKLFVRHCFYCHKTIRVTNAQLINHLRGHGFQLGHPEKLVYIEKFVESIENTFRTLHCLYCSVEFDSCHSLMTHMEEKNHMKTHPNDRFFDQFYMINYVEFGKTWMDFLKERSRGESDQGNNVDDDKDWSSWGTEPESIMCLFCKHVCRSWDGTLLHMLVSHNFDFKSKVLQFSFYQQVKLVNYIRRRIFHNQCIACEEQFDCESNLATHMERSGHLCIPDKEYWNHADYFFCTMENDMFLYHLQDQDDVEEDSENSLGARETSNIFRYYDIENSDSESGRSSFNQVIAYANHDESGSNTDSVCEDDQNFIGSDGDSEIREFQKEVKIAFEKSEERCVNYHLNDFTNDSCDCIKIQNTEETSSSKVAHHTSAKIHFGRQKVTPVSQVGSGDSARMCTVAEEFSTSKSVKGFGDTAVKKTDFSNRENSDCYYYCV